jgi:Kef-type K+ transport system membrane component KefB
MSHETRFDPLGFVRRVLVVAVLVVGTVLLHQYAVPGDGFDPRAMLSLGFLILAAYTIGELATSVGIPHITGYLLSGVLFGPSLPEVLRLLAPDLALPPPLDQGLVSRGVLGQLGPIDGLALALIALSAGGELELDELRRSFRYVLGSTIGMAVAASAAVGGVVATLAAVAPWTMPGFEGQPAATGLAMAAVMGTLAAATSPALSIAVVHSTGAKGPVSSMALTGAVVGEILLVVAFAGVMAVVLPVVGAEGRTSLTESMFHVAASAAVGLVAGGAIAAYLRVVGVDLVLFLVAAIYGTTFLVASFGGEAAVAFIAAGLVVGNAHRVVPAAGPDVGRTLLVNVERVSRPVFAVFFALAGAKLELQVAAAALVPASAIVVVRWWAVRWGSTFGARLTGAPPAVERHAWTGFVSQAGLAVALAAQARAVLPAELGEAVFTLALSMISVGQVIGPSVLQAGLRAAGEIPESGPTGRPAPERVAAAPTPGGPVPAWPPPEPAPWPVVPELQDPDLDGALSGLDEALQSLVDAEVTAPLEGLRRDAETWVRVLRQQWGRHLRPARWTRLRDGDLARELRRAMSASLVASVEVVRAFDAKLGADRSPFVPGPLVERVDALVAQLPGPRAAPVPDSFLEPRPESAADRARRALVRLGARTFGARRTVSLRDLGRYHLSGGVPAALEPVLALLPHARCHVADRTTEAFALLAEAVDARAAQAEAGAPAEVVLAALDADLRAVEVHTNLLIDELGAIARDGTERGRAALGGLADRLYADAERAGTFALASRGPRYAPRFRERTRTSARLAVAVSDARVCVESRYDELLLELELLAMRVGADEVASGQARALEARYGRQVVAGLAQIDLDLDRWIELATDAIDRSPSHDELSTRLSAGWAEVSEGLASAVTGLRATADHLSSGAWLDPLTAVLVGAQNGVSAVHLLGVRRAPSDRATLPAAGGATSVPTGRRVGALVESQVLQPLRALGEELAAEVAEALAAAVEVERVTQFNVDLARAELELVPGDDPPTPDRREQLRSMLVGAPHRVRMRLRQRREVVGARDGAIVGAVSGVVSAVRVVGETLRVADVARAPSGWWAALPDRAAVAWGAVRRGIGDDRWLGLARTAGVAGAVDSGALVAALRPPVAAAPVPHVYARLFSDLPFEAGELVAGRQAELDAVRTALSTGLRSAAVVGIDPHGARALVTAALGAGRAPLWFDADGPAEPGTVARWLEPLAGSREQVVVIENLRWLHRRAPGGSAELEELARRILADGGRNRWVLLADGGVWGHVAAATSLRDAMGAVVELAPLSIDEVRRAIESRHAMSGYTLAFGPQEDLLFRARRWLTRGTEEERSGAAWFRSLHDASGGVLQDAMRLWLASVSRVDDTAEVVTLGAVPRPPTAHLAALDDHKLQTLLETRRTGWTDADSVARLFRMDPESAATHVAQLAHLGVLVPHGRVAKIAPHLRGPVERLLAARGWT